MSLRILLVVESLTFIYRTTTKTHVQIEVQVAGDGQQTVRSFTIMFSSSGAADEFTKMFKQVSCYITK